jgi:hypothetical protein
MSVIVGKYISAHLPGIGPNAGGGIYTAACVQQRAEERRFQAKLCPQTGTAALMENLKVRFMEKQGTKWRVYTQEFKTESVTTGNKHERPVSHIAADWGIN